MILHALPILVFLGVVCGPVREPSCTACCAQRVHVTRWSPWRLRRAASSGRAGGKAYAVPYTVTLKGAGPYTSCSPWEWYATVDGSGQVGPSL